MPRTRLRLWEHAAFKSSESCSKAVGKLFPLKADASATRLTRLRFPCSTGQRLRCPDDSACNYSTFDKSALLRHRQRRHGYQTKSTAPKDRCQRIPSAKRTGSSSCELGNPNSDASFSSSPLSETAATKCPCPCPCPCPRLSPSSSSSNLNLRADEADEWLDDDHALRAIKEPVGSIEQSAAEAEGHVISRFPVSFSRTRLAATNFKHCRHCTCKLPTKPVRPTSRSDDSATSNAATCPHREEVMVYKHVRYLVKELFLMATC